MSRPYRARRNASFSAPPLCPIQKMAFSRRIDGRSRALGVGPERLLRLRAVVLRQREDRLLLQRLVLRRPEDRVERAHRAFAPHLREPEDRLLAHLVVGIVPRRLEQDVLVAVGALLGDEEDRLPPEADRGRITPGQHPPEDRPRALVVHLLQRVERGELGVVLVVGAAVVGIGRHGRHRRNGRDGRHRRHWRHGRTGGTRPAASAASATWAAAAGSPWRASSPWIRRASALASPLVAAWGTGRAGYRAPAAPLGAERCPRRGRAKTRASNRRRPRSPNAGSATAPREELAARR